MGKKALYGLVLTLVLIITGRVVFKYYPYIFAKTIVGVVRVKRVTEATTIIGGGSPIPTNQLYSFAISVRDTRGEEHTASSEDRQWAVVEDGKCVEAQFFPYPPWDLEKSGTFFGARLLRLYDCNSEAAGLPARQKGEQ